MEPIRYSFDLADVEWQTLVDDLVADDFHNGRTVEQFRQSAENSQHNCFAWAGDRIIGNLRVLSDGIGNAYVVDVWIQSAYRKQGIARQMIELTLERLPGQHVYLFTDDDAIGFYERIGFQRQGIGVFKIVGEYLKNAAASG